MNGRRDPNIPLMLAASTLSGVVGGFVAYGLALLIVVMRQAS